MIGLSSLEKNNVVQKFGLNIHVGSSSAGGPCSPIH